MMSTTDMKEVVREKYAEAARRAGTANTAAAERRQAAAIR